MPDAKQWAVFAFGLFIAGGFAVQGIVSFSGMVDTQAPQQGQQEMNTDLPNQNILENGLDRNAEEMFYTAIQHDVVFVNGLYETEQQKQEIRNELESLPETFDNRVYLVLESNEDSTIPQTYGVNEFPSALVIGGNQENMPQPTTDITEESITEEVCNSFSTLGDQASVCL